MKATRLVSLLVAAFLVLLAPSAAHAYGGVAGAVSNTAPTATGGGCLATTVTVQGPANSTVRLVVEDADGSVVFDGTATTNADGAANFDIEVCGDGPFTATGFDAAGGVLGVSQFDFPASSGGGGQAADDSDDSTSSPTAGSLPATGSDTRSMLALGGGLALIAVGGMAFVAARRRNA